MLPSLNETKKRLQSPKQSSCEQ